MEKRHYFLVSLGCSKNTVDSESIAALLGRAGYRSTPNAEKAEILIVNTCGFINPARQESLSILRQLAEAKQSGQLLIAAGCMSQLYSAEIVRQVPAIDGIIGTRRWMDILDLIRDLGQNSSSRPLYHLPETPTIGRDEKGVACIAIQGASAYLKIADGCRRPCAYCAIPLIKGTVVSRSPQLIITDAKKLQQLGVREMVLIAQDTTDYGYDLGLHDGLPQLIEQLIPAVPKIEWIRIMYAYPGCVTDRLIEIMASQTQILPYLDIPLQHAHPNTLHRMRRPANVEWVYRIIEKMRAAIPELALRTTFIVGYPGETEKEFQALLDFITDLRFDRVGVFTFSFERGTASESLGDPIPVEIKEERRERLMIAQQHISLEKNRSFIGRALPVLIEGHGDGVSIGRSYRDAPEVDGVVIVEEELPIGEIVPVRITDALPYDLMGVIETDPAKEGN